MKEVYSGLNQHIYFIEEYFGLLSPEAVAVFILRRTNRLTRLVHLIKIFCPTV